MKQRIFVVLALSLGLTACGGGKNSISQSTQKVLDPTGNWMLTATDSQGNHISLGAIFNQVGAVVTANSFSLAEINPQFQCQPFNASFSNGLVQSLNNFTGAIAFSGFGSFTFTSTLADDQKSATGTYAGLPGCTGVGAVGTFTAKEVPSVTGAWSGTIQPCHLDSSTNGVCVLDGAPSSITFTLIQNEANGTVAGTYQSSGIAGITSGNVTFTAPRSGLTPGILTGISIAFHMIDNSGSALVVTGQLGFDGSLKARIETTQRVGNPQVPDSSRYWLVISHFLNQNLRLAEIELTAV